MKIEVLENSSLWLQ